MFRLPYRFRKKNEPQFYLLTCPKCGFKKMYEQGNYEVVVCDPDCAPSSSPEVVEKLPTACPACGAKLKKENLPIKINY
ncbi:MAG: hypothetical protein IJC73_09090 [Lentisphaeria bacterium]|nr:hypothetical protein [Lentisphaeria bacterium]